MQTTRTLILFLAICGLTPTAWGQDFVLENPADPAAASVASIIGTDLVITDSAARQFMYVRRPDLDTPDGQYQAFFSKAVNQYVRWPVSGSGPMQIGIVTGATVNWSPSRMEIRGADGGALGPATFLPGGPLHTGTLVLGPDKICASHIDSAGRLQFFIGYQERWRHYSAEHPPGILVPGAPLRMVADKDSPVPRIYTIGAQGKFVEVIAGRIIQDLAAPPSVRFVPGGQFAVAHTPTGDYLMATERHGRLWRLDPAGGKHQIVEGHLGVLEPGLPILSASAGHDLFMIDRHGAIVSYALDGMGAWHGPEILAEGFASAGHLAIWTHPGTKALEIAAVDRHGKLHILHQTGGGWAQEALPNIKLLPGSPLTAFETKIGLSLTAILADGQWAEFFEAGGTWHERVIATGFPPRAPLGFSSSGPMLFAADITGRLISAFWTGSEWQPVICAPAELAGGQLGPAPRLVSRKVIANRRIDPVVVGLQNSTAEELLVRVMDGRLPGKVEEITLAPHSSSQFSADRDMGGTLEEVYLVPGPAGPVQQVRRFPIPPKPFYDMVVYAKRVTYQYIDRRKNKGPLADFKESSLVSLGAFPLPAGGLLTPGTQLDVYRIATTTRNPGAAAVIDPQVPRP